MSLAHLEWLNPEQRRAVEHGVGEAGGRSGRPLLVIDEPARPIDFVTIRTKLAISGVSDPSLLH